MTDVQNNYNEEEEEILVYTLTDEETGEEIEFEFLEEASIDGKRYFALADLNEETDEYVILCVTGEGEDLVFSTIEDDDEFEKVEDHFNDMLFGEVDYDA